MRLYIHIGFLEISSLFAVYYSRLKVTEMWFCNQGYHVIKKFYKCHSLQTIWHNIKNLPASHFKYERLHSYQAFLDEKYTFIYIHDGMGLVNDSIEDKYIFKNSDAANFCGTFEFFRVRANK